MCGHMYITLLRGGMHTNSTHIVVCKTCMHCCFHFHVYNMYSTYNKIVRVSCVLFIIYVCTTCMYVLCVHSEHTYKQIVFLQNYSKNYIILLLLQ